MVLFAEGTTGDGNFLLPFKSTLFGAADMALGRGRRRHASTSSRWRSPTRAPTACRWAASIASRVLDRRPGPGAASRAAAARGRDRRRAALRRAGAVHRRRATARRSRARSSGACATTMMAPRRCAATRGPAVQTKKTVCSFRVGNGLWTRAWNSTRSSQATKARRKLPRQLPSPQGLRQDLWLPDERLRQPAHGRCAGRDGYARPTHRGRRPRPAQHLPHPREGGREGLFGARPHPQAEGRARQRRPRHDRSASPAASPRPRAARSSRVRPSSTSSSARRPITACPTPCARRGAARRWSRPTTRSRTSSSTCRSRRPPRWRGAASPPSSPCRKAATSSAPSAWCPIRAARRSRGRSRRSWPKPSGWRRPACAR